MEDMDCIFIAEISWHHSGMSCFPWHRLPAPVTAVAAQIGGLNATGLTFVVPKGEVQIAGGRDGQGEVEPVATRWFVLVHGTDGLDDLKISTGVISPSKHYPRHK